MADSAVKSVKLPVFDDKASEYQKWYVRFRAYASVCGFTESIKHTPDPNLPEREDTSLDLSKVSELVQSKARKKNAIAMANLTMALTGDSSMAIIFDVMDNDEWPGGLAWKIIEALKHKYAPEDTMSSVEMSERLSEVSMKTNEDPATLFTQLAAIKTQFKTLKVSEAAMIAVVLKAAPEMYDLVLTSLQVQKKMELKVIDLRETMNVYYRGKVKSKDGDKDTGDKELNLSAFEGTCYDCKKPGHKSYQCPNKKSRGTNYDKGKKFMGKCNDCNKFGHMKKDCWKNPDNANKKPQWLKDKEKNREHGNATVKNTGRVEYLLCQVTKEEMVTDDTSQSILDDPNVWIADSGATSDSTPHAEGMIKEMKATYADAVTVGNGNTISASKVGNIPGMICDKDGKEIKSATLKDVTVLPDAKFNLFSLTKRLKDGWTMDGNKTAITLQKGDTKITFDIVIQTKRGLLFCMYHKRNGEIAGAMTAKQQTKMTINEAHQKLGHASEAATRRAAKRNEHQNYPWGDESV